MFQISSLVFHIRKKVINIRLNKWQITVLYIVNIVLCIYRMSYKIIWQQLFECVSQIRGSIFKAFIIFFVTGRMDITTPRPVSKDLIWQAASQSLLTPHSGSWIVTRFGHIATFNVGGISAIHIHWNNTNDWKCIWKDLTIQNFQPW